MPGSSPLSQDLLRLLSLVDTRRIGSWFDGHKLFYQKRTGTLMMIESVFKVIYINILYVYQIP
jgi:hypothetical protein